MSEVSVLSVFANPNWSDIDRELFDERAAIVEYEGGLNRNRAEFLARRWIDEDRRRRHARRRDERRK